jgi:Zn-dependent metalloprotease
MSIVRSDSNSYQIDSFEDSQIGRPAAARYACRCLNCILPPQILKRLLESSDKEVRKAALETLLASAQLRGERTVRNGFGASMVPNDGRRTIFDAGNSTNLQAAVMKRSESGAASADDAVNRAFDGLGKTRDFYKTVLNRNSMDDHGMRMNGFVHRGVKFNNALWDGQEMLFGDGDGMVFTDLTRSLDVIAHELTHGVTQFTANLTYHNQPGALNESISDVFGSLVKQWSLNQKAADADWLIGAEVFTPGIQADALRSMKAPGTAFDNDLFGKDPQPDHMNKFAHLPDDEDNDSGGVHINSGIPNRAFYLTATNIGGFAWEAPGHIWYESLKASTETTEFQEFADTTYSKAGALYGTGSVEQKAVLSAWSDVGVPVSSALAVGLAAEAGSQVARASADADSFAALTQQIESLSAQVQTLVKAVSTLTPKTKAKTKR